MRVCLNFYCFKFWSFIAENSEAKVFFSPICLSTLDLRRSLFYIISSDGSFPFRKIITLCMMTWLDFLTSTFFNLSLGPSQKMVEEILETNWTKLEWLYQLADARQQMSHYLPLWLKVRHTKNYLITVGFFKIWNFRGFAVQIWSYCSFSQAGIMDLLISCEGF